MENSIFIYTDNKTNVDIKTLHICMWEFKDNSSLVEFGCEISKESITSDKLSISIYIPWYTTDCEVNDLYKKLSSPDNSRLIFNKSINGTDSLDEGSNISGVIHKFIDGGKICILPLGGVQKDNKVITINIDLKSYNIYNSGNKPNIYFRFWVKPNIPYISMRKKGINKSTIIFDLKVNEKRNIPNDGLFNNKNFIKIHSVFLMMIVPNRYDITFYESEHLRKVRGLEYAPFKEYLSDDRIKENEHIVVAYKKDELDSYSFFSIFTKERIGPGQFALAILINIVCGFLLFLPSYRKTFNPEIKFTEVWALLPSEIFIALGIAFLTLIYFIWPSIINLRKKT